MLRKQIFCIYFYIYQLIILDIGPIAKTMTQSQNIPYRRQLPILYIYNVLWDRIIQNTIAEGRGGLVD